MTLLTNPPSTWDDRSVLKSEVLQSKYKATLAPRTVNEILKCRRSIMVVKQWLAAAFDTSRHGNYEDRYLEIRKVTKKTVTLFLQFYICLRDNGRSNALALLNEARTNFGQGDLSVESWPAKRVSLGLQGGTTHATLLKKLPNVKGVKPEDEDATKVLTAASERPSPTIKERVQLGETFDENHEIQSEEHLKHQVLSRVGTSRRNLKADSEPPSEWTTSTSASSTTELCQLGTHTSSTTSPTVVTTPELPQEMARTTENSQKRRKTGEEETFVDLLPGSPKMSVVVFDEPYGISESHNSLEVREETSSGALDISRIYDGCQPMQCDARAPGLDQPSHISTEISSQELNFPPLEPAVKRLKVAHYSSHEEMKMKMEECQEINLLTTPPPLLPTELVPEPPTPRPRAKNRNRNRHRPMGSIGSDLSVPHPSQTRPTFQATPPDAPSGPYANQRNLEPPQTITSSRETPLENRLDCESSLGCPVGTLALSHIPKLEEDSLNPVSSPLNVLNYQMHDSPPRNNLHTSDHLKVDDEVPSNSAKNESFIIPPLDFVLDARFPKPRLPHLPPIWAESRQEICEGFDWFRSYQGGVYHADNAVKGYMLGGFAARRDVFEHGGRFIISHGGGKAESVLCRDGLYTSAQASDQLADDKSVRALLDNYWTGRPLVLVIDDKYVLFPYDLTADGVTYAVLGFYTIAYAWAEYQLANNDNGRVVRYKFAFQWCEKQGDPWWLYKPAEGHNLELDNFPQAAKLHEPEKNVGTIISTGLPAKISEKDLYSNNFPLPDHSSDGQRICEVCRISSPNVYSSWFCLEPNCKMFWRNPVDRELVEDPGEYRQDFLRLVPQREQLEDLVLSPEPVTVAQNEPLTGYAFTRGVHCPKCGRLSCRFQWEKLFCLRCSWKQDVDIPHRSAEGLRAGRLPVPFDKFYLNDTSDITYSPVTTFSFENGGRGTVQTFYLPENRGRLHHISACTEAGIKEADQVFKRYQEQANSGELRFRRWPMRAHKCRGTLLTNYFSHNAGEPYQYVGGDANTVPFEEAPAVSEARSLIEKRIREALHLNASFNEVLSCAYMERQRMAFHSDAEVGLGPLVAGLSLGSPALMHFRLHARYDPEYQKRGILMTVVLRHGDILVMDGAGVQDFYEHTVVPNNFRIAATARQITRQHHVKKEESS